MKNYEPSKLDIRIAEVGDILREQQDFLNNDNKIKLTSMLNQYTRMYIEEHTDSHYNVKK
tara:strand:+ start:360 stop:539 length:180 start_codon:yes stop_codon:yes gene_type:complete